MERAGLAFTSGQLDPRRDRLGEAGYVNRSLQSAITNDLLTRVPAAFRARINDVLLTALVLAVAAWSEQDGKGAEQR